MTEQERAGLLGLGHKAIENLPSQFLLLVVINALFLGSLIWFLDRRDAARERLITPVIAACLHPKP